MLTRIARYFSGTGVAGGWGGPLLEVAVPGGSRTPLGMIALPGFNGSRWRAFYTYLHDHRSFYPYPPAIQGFYEAVFVADFQLTWV